MRSRLLSRMAAAIRSEIAAASGWTDPETKEETTHARDDPPARHLRAVDR